MEAYLRYGSAQDIPGYDCRVANKSEFEWSETGWSSLSAGTACLLFGITTELLYIFALCAIYRSSLLSLSCYKIMFALGFFDVVAIFVNSILASYYFISGAVYCSHSELMYISGCIGFGVWCGSSLTCLILVLNRLLDFWKPAIAHFIFQEDRTWYVLLAPVFYAVLITHYSMPVLFNSSKYSFFFDPFIEEEKVLKYYSVMHVVNNLIVVVSTLVFYTIMMAVIVAGSSIKMSKNQKSIIIQTSVICIVTMLVDLGCVYMQFWPPPTSLVIAVQICWMCAHGIPAYIYVFVNRRIRKSCITLLKIKESSGSGRT